MSMIYCSQLHGKQEFRAAIYISVLQPVFYKDMQFGYTRLAGRCGNARCNDPADQFEFFVHVPRLQTFNWIYCYRELIVMQP